MPGIPFIKEFKFDYGTAMEVTPLIRRVVAHNPSPFTFKGTGTYIVGHGKVAVVDPGPDMQEHARLPPLRAVRGETVTHILVTHTHIDHVPATPRCRRRSALVYSSGPHPRLLGDEKPRRKTPLPNPTSAADGDVIQGDGWNVEAVHTPGHISNHLCLRSRRTRRSCRATMSWAGRLAVISPPATWPTTSRACASSCRATRRSTSRRTARRSAILTVRAVLHRASLGREAQIMARLKEGPQTIPQIPPRTTPTRRSTRSRRRPLDAGPSHPDGEGRPREDRGTARRGSTASIACKRALSLGAPCHLSARCHPERSEDLPCSSKVPSLRSG